MAVASAGAWRLAAGWPAHAALRAGVAATAVLFAIGAAGWMRAGPLSPGWARRAGTPAALLARSGGTGGVSGVRSGQSAFPAPPFQLPVTGTVTTANGPGSGERTVTIAAASGTSARLRIVISGPAVAGGVEMTGSQVSLGPPGLPEIATALELVAFGGTSGRPGARALRDLHQLPGLVAGRGACHLPDGVARLVASALRVFPGDVRRHERGPCAGARGRPVFPVPASEHAGER